MTEWRLRIAATAIVIVGMLVVYFGPGILNAQDSIVTVRVSDPYALMKGPWLLINESKNTPGLCTAGSSSCSILMTNVTAAHIEFKDVHNNTIHLMKAGSGIK